jgi:hypothetical protein
VIRPRVEINAIERDPLLANSNDGHATAHFTIEAILVHAKVTRCVAQPNEPGWQHD